MVTEYDIEVISIPDRKEYIAAVAAAVAAGHSVKILTSGNRTFLAEVLKPKSAKRKRPEPAAEEPTPQEEPAAEEPTLI